MSMVGIITASDVAHNARLIVHDYGLRVFYRCLCSVCLHRQTTFLACVFERRTHWARRLSYKIVHRA